jgi:8-oxo-dGTP diphosphatase
MAHSDIPPCYPLTVETAIFTLYQRDLKVCLFQRGQPPFDGSWALPSVTPTETESLDDAAQRCIFSIIGSGGDSESDPFFQQLYSFGAPDRDPRGRAISIAYFALVAKDRLPEHMLDDANAQVRWHSAYNPPPLAFDHGEILSYALTRLRYKIEYSAVAFQLMPEEFTLRELQDAYMIILNDQKLDKANFRKKIREANILEPSNRFQETGGRPANLFRFRKDAKLEIKTRRFFP